MWVITAMCACCWMCSRKGFQLSVPSCRSRFMQVDDEDTTPRPWNNIAQYTRTMVSFLHKAVSP